MQNNPILEFLKVDKFFSQKQILNQISFSVFPGQIIALLGVNGAGKTTAIKMMLGQEIPTSGRVTLFGGNPKNYTSRFKVGATPQNIEFPDGIKTKELLRFVHGHYKNPHPIQFMADTFELNGFMEERGSKLSGGQKRRLALALSFIGNPEIIFLDEPTTGLDVGARKILWEFIKNESKNGKTVFLTTHYLEEIEQVATRVIFLNKGEIIVDGTVDDIKKMASTSLVKVSFEYTGENTLSDIQYAQKITRDENKLILETSEPDNLIRELVQKNIYFTKLSIEHENLESAFLNLSKPEVNS